MCARLLLNNSQASFYGTIFEGEAFQYLQSCQTHTQYTTKTSDYLTNLLLLGFLLRLHIIAMTIQINMTQIVIRALVVAATMMINVRLASSVSLLPVGAPTVVDDSTATDVPEVTDTDVVKDDKILSL